jgi:hypothetical protein
MLSCEARLGAEGKMLGVTRRIYSCLGASALANSDRASCRAVFYLEDEK